MATQEIDKLALDLEVTGLDQASVDNVMQLADALEKLQTALESDSLGKLKELGIKLNTKNFEKQINDVKKIADNAGKEIKNNLKQATANIGIDKGTVPKVQQTQAQDVSLDKGANFNNFKAQIEEANKVLSASNVKASDVEKTTKKLKTSINSLGKEANKTSGKSGGLGKFLEALKRVAIYRFIRAVIKQISQAFQEGIKNVALFDANANKTMSQLSTSITNIKNSLGLMMQPIVETFAPIVQQISQAFVEIGNAISKANAQMKGLSTYTKISSKYMEDYKKSVQGSSKFSFDTFQTLGGSDTTSSMFETEQITEANDGLNDMQDFLASIKDLVLSVFGTIKEIGGFIAKILAMYAHAITQINGMLTEVFDTINPILQDIVDLLTPVYDVILTDLLPSVLDIVDTALQPILSIINLIWAILEPIVEQVCDILQPVISIISDTVEAINVILEPILGFVTQVVDFIAPIVGGVVELLANLGSIEPIVQLVADLVSSMMEGVAGIGSLLKGDVSGAWEHFKNMGEGAWDAIKNFGLNVWDNLKSVGEAFGSVWDKIKEAGEKCWNGIKKAGIVMAEAVVNGLLSGLNWIIKKINNITSGLSKVWSWAGIPKIPNIPEVTWKLSIDSYANGGKLTGELWQMNEMGNPEMLFNSRNSGNTSVINQAQLGEAFLQAILNSGVIDAIRESGNIILDGKDIAQSRSFKRELNRTNPNLNLR